MKYFVSIYFVFIIFLIKANNLELSSFFTEEEKNSVLTGNIITRQYIKFNATKENTDNNIEIPKTVYMKTDVKNYELLVDEKAFFKYNLEEKKLLDLYNIINNPEQLKGMQYYSRRVGEVKQLIMDSYLIDNKGLKIKYNKKEKVESYLKQRFRQQDNKFGTLNFTAELYNIDKNFILITTCDDSIPFVSNPGEYFIISYFIYDEKNKGYFYYSVYASRIRSELLINGKGIMTLSPTTFSNRLRAATVHFAKLIGYDWSKKLAAFK